ncbi:HNH/ENDO VII family nuclease [Fusobacterium pseudoperiodonticum]|uniref:Endonuclease VII n=1 Tax=Fusobacterium pseudoperiodonticum TaxID=2663009 RepID=A0A2D3NW57_9FUSO|nr:HNH/ENDO VII family nuclease [Fusobacterium pseudoperiodonticum]ATV59246.1 endonuclease VII [Fusobacterium pseudoperiodonticum]
MPSEILATIKEVGKIAKDVVEKTGEIGLEKGKQIVEKIKDFSESSLSELVDKSIENIKSAGDGVMTKLDDIKNLTPEQLKEKMNQFLEQGNHSVKETETDENVKEGLTDEEKTKIKEETGWSDEIVDAIGSWKEYEIYKNANLVEAEIDGKKCLIRNDINWNQKDEMGRTNKERAEQGLSPINKDGKVIELHHIGQHSNSPLAELTQEEHRGKGNDGILHDKTKESEINRQAFAEERSNHWSARAQESEEKL